jgi:hypothetical protein
MNAILKYHLRQLFNYWYHLRFRIRLELIFLFLIFYIFFTDKLVQYFRQLLVQPDTSPIGLTTLALHILLVIIFITTPFIYFNLFPKQKGLSTLSLFPLKKSESLMLQLVYFFKYHILIFLIALPILTALLISSGLQYVLYIVFFSFSSLFLSTMMILVLASIYQKRINAVFRYYLYLVLYILFFAVMYWFTDIYFYATILVALASLILMFKVWDNHSEAWDQTLSRYRPVAQNLSQTLSKLTYFNFPHFISKSLSPFIIKEFLSHLRNKNYMRLKIVSLTIYLLLLILIATFYFEYYTSAISILTILLIWEHYSHQFNEKYVSKESLFYMKVLPVTYLQYSLSKFLSEFLYIIIILILILILTVLYNVELIKIVNVLGIVTLFSVFVLYLITMIRILFYDNPRMAGYAYHFLIVFSMVMIFNFHLVGPIITIFVILYIQFISYRQFTR